MEKTEKLNSVIQKTPNKLYTLLASSRFSQDHRRHLENKRLGKFGKQLYDYKPRNEFIASKVLNEIYTEANQNINKREYDARKIRKE